MASLLKYCSRLTTAEMALASSSPTISTVIISRIRAETAIITIITAPAPAHAASIRPQSCSALPGAKLKRGVSVRTREGYAQAGAGADTKHIRTGKRIAEEGLHQQAAY